jgi:hypothetical protein
MDQALKDIVRQRAGNRCEYCRLRQEHLPFSTFQVEHVTPRKHGGGDDPANLALACERCNFHKGPNLTGIDPTSGSIVELFHPRQQTWEEHFAFHGPLVVGLTAAGRATVRVLNMNESRRVQLRQELLNAGDIL